MSGQEAEYTHTLQLIPTKNAQSPFLAEDLEQGYIKTYLECYSHTVLVGNKSEQCMYVYMLGGHCEH